MSPAVFLVICWSVLVLVFSGVFSGVSWLSVSSWSRRLGRYAGPSDRDGRLGALPVLRWHNPAASIIIVTMLQTPNHCSHVSLGLSGFAKAGM